jgi:hypothetical protein
MIDDKLRKCNKFFDNQSYDEQVDLTQKLNDERIDENDNICTSKGIKMINVLTSIKTNLCPSF